MTTQDEFRQHIKNLVNTEREKRNELQVKIEKIDSNIAALEVTLSLIEAEKPRQYELVSDFKFTPTNIMLDAKSIPEALVRLAKFTGQPVSYSDAAKIMLKTGLSKGKPRNVMSHIYHLMQDSDDWIRVAPGKFKYIGK